MTKPVTTERRRSRRSLHGIAEVIYPLLRTIARHAHSFYTALGTGLVEIGRESWRERVCLGV